MDEGLHKLFGFLITIVTAMYEQMAYLITVMADQIERFEYFLIPYLKFIINLIYLLPDLGWTCLEILFSRQTYYNLISNHFNFLIFLNLTINLYWRSKS